ncbi:MAG: Holliday junction resolvase RuvX [Candidatus Dojkabacteria bacterium]|nr:Holliday junction resolvase RuvX [Candidatus Dojkabacteria bacterium]
MTKYPILAIDYGTKHFGTAISDYKGIIASPLEVISITKNQSIYNVIDRIIQICKEYKIQTILLGMPQIFSETQELTRRKINNFKKKLSENIDIPIIICDESFSTTSAQNMLTSSGQSTRKSRGKIDMVSAAYFLQEFLNSSNKNND